MDIFELILLAVGLSMDAFAVAVCKGLAMERVRIGDAVAVGAWFWCVSDNDAGGGLPAGIDLRGLYHRHRPLVAFFLLAAIGGNMIREPFFRGDRAGSLSQCRQNAPFGRCHQH